MGGGGEYSYDGIRMFFWLAIYTTYAIIVAKYDIKSVLYECLLLLFWLK